MRETTSLGAAIAAGFAVDVWKEFEELKDINRKDRTIFKSEITEKQSKAMYRKWSRAVEMCRGWIEEEEKDNVEFEAEEKEKKAGGEAEKVV